MDFKFILRISIYLTFDKLEQKNVFEFILFSTFQQLSKITLLTQKYQIVIELIPTIWIDP